MDTKKTFAWLRMFAGLATPAEADQARLHISALETALETALTERDDSRRAHIRSVFHCGDTAVVNNHAAGIRSTKCYSHHEVAVIWWGDNEADRLFPK